MGTLEFEFPDASGQSVTQVGDAAVAAMRFHELGVLKVKRAAAPEPLRAIGSLLATSTAGGPKLANPEVRTRVDIFDYERDAGLKR